MSTNLEGRGWEIMPIVDDGHDAILQNGLYS
jgi:hypothetical protein